MPVFLSDIVEDTSGSHDGDEGDPSNGLKGTAPSRKLRVWWWRLWRRRCLCLRLLEQWGVEDQCQRRNSENEFTEVLEGVESNLR
jgi:hypothetical protein